MAEPSPSSAVSPRRALHRALVAFMVLFFVGAGLGAGGRWFWQGRYVAPPPTALPFPSATPSPLPPTSTPSPTLPPAVPPASPEASTLAFPRGLTVLALQQGAYSQLFVYAPERLALTPLTTDPTDHITPSLSPDGHTLAYAAQTSRGWDIFLLSLEDGVITPLTHDAAYDAAPTWSPDGQWLAYEHSDGTNLDIFIRDRAAQQTPIRLTEHPGADSAPAWAPQGRQIAFVSTREGVPQIFLADLDQAGAARFRRLSRPENGPARHPVWSPDGRYLAWGQSLDGVPMLFVWDAAHPDDRPARPVGMGWWPAWGEGHTLAAVVRLPNGAALTAYALDGGAVLPLVPLPGLVEGFAVGTAAFRLPPSLPTPTPMWTPQAPPDAYGRLRVVPLEDVEAPYPELSDVADEAFAALRALVAQKAGWDVLGALDNAFVPLTAPLPPGLGQDWLYTGRAFALPVFAENGGRPLLAVVREDIAPYTYWRVYARAARQDGTLGRPLAALPWDFAARARGDVTAFERGGDYAAAVPEGFWVDVTALAQALGWERLASLPNWRAFVPAARAGEFVLRQGLTWREAMLQIYPPEALATPTPHPTSATPFITPFPTATPMPPQP